MKLTFNWLKNIKRSLSRLIARWSILEQAELSVPGEGANPVASDEKDTAAEDRERIAGNGWQQGAIITCSDEICCSLGLPNDGCDTYILVSHSCDILAYKYKTEPLVEFVGGTYSKKENKSLSHRRHPRQLQIPVDGGEKPFLTLNIKSRYFVDRRVLVEVPASHITFSDRSMRELQMWMAARYRRTAFPDEFVDRASNALDAIREELEANGDQGVHSLYIHLNTFDELLKGQNYEIVLMGTTEEDLGEGGATSWRDAEEFLEFVVAHIKDSDGISVRHYELVAEDGITLSTLRRLKLMDFDYISHRENSDVPEMVG
ncbi:MAG: hypothetical protein AB2745_00495 [Candidatus Thiodiazotropha endolucinida]